MQEANLAFILLNHPLDCPICDKGGECPLQDQTMRYGPGISQLVEAKRHKKKHYLISDTIVLDQERCVLCWRCIRYLEEWEDKPAARPLRARRRHDHRHPGRQAGRRQDQRQHHRHLPGGRTDQPRGALRLPPLGDRAHAQHLHALLPSAATSAWTRARTRCAASSAARTCRSTTSGSATRAASPTAGSTTRTG